MSSSTPTQTPTTTSPPGWFQHPNPNPTRTTTSSAAPKISPFDLPHLSSKIFSSADYFSLQSLKNVNKSFHQILNSEKYYTRLFPRGHAKIIAPMVDVPPLPDHLVLNELVEGFCFIVRREAGYGAEPTVEARLIGGKGSGRPFTSLCDSLIQTNNLDTLNSFFTSSSSQPPPPPEKPLPAFLSSSLTWPPTYHGKIVVSSEGSEYFNRSIVMGREHGHVPAVGMDVKDFVREFWRVIKPMPWSHVVGEIQFKDWKLETQGRDVIIRCEVPRNRGR